MGRALFLRHLICRLRGTAQEEGRLSARYIPERVPQTTNSATFLSRPSNDKFQAGRHHPDMGVFERVNRFLFDRRAPNAYFIESQLVYFIEIWARDSSRRGASKTFERVEDFRRLSYR